MIFLNIFLVIFIIGITIIAIYFLLREKIPLKKKILLGILRVLIALSLIIAFIEPSFTISRFVISSHSMGILIDASQSMTLFRSDSIVNEFKKEIQEIEKSIRSKKRKVKWFIFGDTLKNITQIENINFNSRQSNFPFDEISTELKEIDEVILITDGNWTNQKLELSQIQNKIVWYLKLPTIYPVPFISIEAPETLISYSDSITEHNFTCKGFASEESKLEIVLEKEGKEVYFDTMVVSKGYFYFPYTLKMKDSKKGFNLYKLTVVNRNGKTKCSNFFIHKVVPSLFRYSLYFDNPSLDIRFLKLALNRDKRFVELDSNSSFNPDVIFIFTSHPPINFKNLKNTLTVYIGCVPGKEIKIEAGSDQKIFISDPTIVNPFFNSGDKNFPPLSEVIKSNSIKGIHSWISFSFSKDTIPIVFTGEYNRKKVMVCAFSPVWQWDFLPLSYTSGESDVFTFSNSLVNAVAMLLYSMQNDTFVICPVGNIRENKYIKFLYTLPDNNFANQKRAINYECYKKDNNNIIYDTLIEIEKITSLFNHFFLSPLDRGSYIIKATFVNNDLTYKSECSFEVLEDNEELSVEGQNEALLKEVGKPLDTTDDTTLNSIFRDYDKELLSTVVPYRVTIKRDWWLLLNILSLFTFEWFLRKIWNLER